MTQEVDEVENTAEDITSSITAVDERAIQCIKRYTMGSMAVGVIPFPFVDMAALSVLQLKMLHTLAKVYGIEFKANMGKSAITSLVGGIAPVYSAAPVAASLSKFIPVVGHAVSYSSLVVLNGASTYAIGKVFQQHFASGGTFLTFEPETVRNYFSKQFDKGKEIVSSLKNSKDSSSSKSNSQANSENSRKSSTAVAS